MSVTEHSNPVRTLVNVAQTVKRPRYLHGAVRQWPALLSLTMLSLVLLAAVFPQALSPHEPFQQNLSVRLQPPAWLDGGNWTYPLGTDQLGRDILTRIIYGARISLAVGFAAVAISGLLGVILGLLAGFYGGWVERLITRLIDTQLAIPRILLAVSIIAVLGQGVTNVILVLGFAGWMTYARVVRAQVLSLKEREYVEAARMLSDLAYLNPDQREQIRQQLFIKAVQHVDSDGGLADGSYQISVTGPVYRGPGASASGPRHHYMFEVYALDTTLDVEPTDDAFETRRLVMDAMQGHVLGKAVYGGLFRRPQ